MSPETVRLWFFEQYRRLGMKGASSHSGRRTFLTTAARKISEAGGSLRDVQALVGHKHLTATQRYIEESANAKRKLINLI
jgi:integrase/recombinase XerD